MTSPHVGTQLEPNHCVTDHRSARSPHLAPLAAHADSFDHEAKATCCQLPDWTADSCHQLEAVRDGSVEVLFGPRPPGGTESPVLVLAGPEQGTGFLQGPFGNLDPER